MKDSNIDARVFGVALVLALVAAVIASLIPALRLSKVDLQQDLKQGERQSHGGRTGLVRNILVAWQAGLAVVLLAVTGMAISSVVRAWKRTKGFDPHNVVTMGLVLPQRQYPKARQRAALLSRVLEGLQAIPGVTDAAASSTCDPARGFNRGVFVVTRGNPVPSGPNSMVAYCGVTSSYFRVFHIALERGSFPASWDIAAAPALAIVNETLARRYFPGQDAVGKEITVAPFYDTNASLSAVSKLEIVGVAQDVTVLWTGWPEIFVPEMRESTEDFTLMFRSRSDPRALIPLARRAVRDVDPDQAVFRAATEEQALAESWATPGLITFLLLGFGTISLMLAAAGTFGVVSYAVTCRTHEIGIRMTLGAQPATILRAITIQGMKWVLLGLVLGGAVAFPVSRLAVGDLSWLPNVRSVTALGLAGVAVVLFGVALLACYLPARRAAKVDPMLALRHE
jgi:putative ABC transport system permease protein